MTSRKVGLRRLLRLADHMETVDPKRFNMTEWVMSDDATAMHCGTGGCIAGHAVEITAFRRAGYCLLAPLNPDGFLVPGFRDFKDDDALEDFFTLDYKEVMNVFHDEEDLIKTPKQAARHLREFVKQAEGN